MCVYASVRQILGTHGWLRVLPVFLLAALLLIVIAGPFVGLAYEDDMVADYAVWAVDTLDDAAVVRKTTRTDATHVIGAMVFAYGWNDDFIVAKQHPVREWPKVDTGTTNWFIIEVESAKIHGPLTEEQFSRLRQEIGVPTQLTFTKEVGRRIR